MNEAPKGKIGGLPKAVQEQVTRRMEGGEKGGVWSSGSMPDRKCRPCGGEFAGKPNSRAKRVRWRQHGYQPSLRQQQALKWRQK